MDYIKKLEKEYDKSPKAFHEHTSEIKQSQKEIKRIMNNFAKEVDDFLKEK